MTDWERMDDEERYVIMFGVRLHHQAPHIRSKRPVLILASLLFLLVGLTAAFAQNVTVIGPVTPGNIPQFNSPTVIKDSGNPGGAAAFANPTGSVGLTVVNGAATSAMRSDAAPPLSASVQSALTSTINQVLTGTGAFGFSSITNTQLTALINPFTSGLSGAVPASGGGTTNFLRADGTFAAPPATGAWTNTRLAKTAAYTTLTGDCGSTLALGGSAFFPATFNAPSGYATTCAFEVTNEDVGRGKLIIPQFASSTTSLTIGTGSKAFTTASGLNVPSGQRYRAYSLANPTNFMSGTLTSYSSTTLTLSIDTAGGSGTLTDWQIAPEIMLWPQQSQLIYNQNNVWLIGNTSQRWKHLSQQTFHVDKTNGSDSNDCLATTTGACATAQAAYNDIMNQMNVNGFTPIIAMATGQTHTAALTMAGVPNGSNLIQLSPDGNASFTWGNAANCISIADGAELDLRLNQFGGSGGVAFACNTGNSTANAAIYMHNQTVVLDLEGGPPVWNPGGANDSFLLCDGYCQWTIGNGITQNGGTGLHLINMLAAGHGTLSGALAGTSGTLSGIFFGFGPGIINSGYSSSGWTTPGTSQFIANFVIITNGITPQGGFGTLDSGNTGTACSANTSTNC